MFKVMYWLVALMCLFVLPGVSIIMAVLYGFYAFLAPFFKPSRVKGVSAGDDPYGGPQNAEVAPQELDTGLARLQAAAYAAEAEALDLERLQDRKEAELNAQNAAAHQAAISQADEQQVEQQSWQDRLEAEAIR